MTFWQNCQILMLGKMIASCPRLEMLNTSWLMHIMVTVLAKAYTEKIQRGILELLKTKRVKPLTMKLNPSENCLRETKLSDLYTKKNHSLE